MPHLVNKYVVKSRESQNDSTPQINDQNNLYMPILKINNNNENDSIIDR